MRIANYLAAVAAVCMTVAPAMAAPVNPASGLSVSNVARAGAPASAKQKLSGGGIIIALLAAAAVIAGIVVIADSDDNSDSP